MALLFNLLWFTICGGFLVFFGYLFGGVILCLTIIGIPAGVQCIKMSLLGVAPFGQCVQCYRGYGVVSTPLNVLWLLCAGLLLTLIHIILGIIFLITIIGIPFGLQHFKLATLALTPFGKHLA